jgi:hypothetical protein
MVRSIAISDLIQLTLLGVTAVSGCRGEPEGDDGENGVDSCSMIDQPIEVTDWNLDSTRFNTLVSDLEQYGTPWAELDDQQMCELVCLYASGKLDYELDDGTGGPPYSEEEHTLQLENCTLTLIVEADTVVSGSVSCNGTLSLLDCYVVGRRPLAHREELPCGPDLQAWLDATARMEHLSIAAFLELANQLAALAAPRQLIERCHAAAEDERRHVALLVGLGASPPTSNLVPVESSRLAIALHNATEGCVAETWSALLARHQSEHAADSAMRRAFAEIADDETRHAQLAWDLDRWLGKDLDANEVIQVRSSRAEALSLLGHNATVQALAMPVELRTTLGLPDPRRASALGREFGERLAAA